jgi:MoaA/NifB/PqqE/SkfB family radical SAM enzyme
MDISEVLTPTEQARRDGLKFTKPHVHAKMAKFGEKIARGESIAIIRVEYSYLCNFSCEHCCAEPFMDHKFTKVQKAADKRPRMTIEDVKTLSRQADEIGLARFVITGGEPLVMKDFDEVVAAIDPDKHYIISDSNGWFLDDARAKHIKSIGVDKIQMSLDSSIPEEHDHFRRKPGSFARVMKGIDACQDAGLHLILSTCLTKGRAKTKEFLDLCELAKKRGIGLYVTYAKPVGAYLGNTDCLITKEDADIVRDLEKEYPVFTHMTPSYGMYLGCITVKGIVTVTSTGEVEPCPYIHVSIGNFMHEHLRDILDRGMRIRQFGEHRPDCIIGENHEFIQLITDKTRGRQLPVPYTDVFTEADFMR